MSHFITRRKIFLKLKKNVIDKLRRQLLLNGQKIKLKSGTHARLSGTEVTQGGVYSTQVSACTAALSHAYPLALKYFKNNKSVVVQVSLFRSTVGGFSLFCFFPDVKGAKKNIHTFIVPFRLRRAFDDRKPRLHTQNLKLHYSCTFIYLLTRRVCKIYVSAERMNNNFIFKRVNRFKNLFK